MLPRLIHHDHFDLYTYGLFVAIGVLVGTVLAVRFCKRQKIDSDKAFTLAMVAVLSGIIGAKALDILLDWIHYSRQTWHIFSLTTLQTGGVFSGGLVTAIAFSAWYIHKHHLPSLRTADAFTPALAIGHALGRLGCFAAGCCYGRPTAHWWGIAFNNPLAKDLSGTLLGVRLQPTQLFESAIEFANFFILLGLLNRKRFDGQVAGTYLVLYGVARFFLEFLRGDPGRGEAFGGLMTGTQLIAVVLVIVGGLLGMATGHRRATSARSGFITA